MPSLKDIYDSNYADKLLQNNNTKGYLNYLKQLRLQTDNAEDFNQINRDIVSLENSVHKEDNILGAHADDKDYIKAYRLVNAVDNGYSIPEGDDGYEEFNNYRQQIEKLGSQVDDDGNVTKRAAKLMFAFNTDYDYNNFLETVGYTENVLKENNIEAGKLKGKRYVTVDKGNPLFSSILKGVNELDDMSDSGGFFEWYGKMATRPFKRAARAYHSTGEGFWNAIGGVIHGAATLIGDLATGSELPNPTVAMFGIDENNVMIPINNNTYGARYSSELGITADKSNVFDYKAIGDYALSDYKKALSYLNQFKSEDEDFTVKKVHLLNYLTANEANARDYLNATNDYKSYNDFLTEEYRRADIAIMSDALADHEVFIDEKGDGIVRPVNITELPNIQRLLRNAISEGGDTNEARRVHYQAGYDDDGDVGCYITIADKSKDGNLVNDFDYTNTLAGRTIFVKGMLTKQIEEAIHRDTHHRANMEVNQMLKYGYDFHLNDGSKLLEPSHSGATYVSSDGNRRYVNPDEMRAILNEQYATDDAINVYRMQINANNSILNMPKLKTKQQENIFKTASAIVEDSYGSNMQPGDKITKATMLYLNMCRSLGIKVEE